MSPKIGISVSAFPREWAEEKRTPAMRVQAAMAHARAAGYPLRYGDLGVAYNHLSGAWTFDRAALHRGLNITGAVLLAIQPTLLPDEDPVGAAARALGVSLAWMEGVQDGWDMVTMSPMWLKSSPELYVRGFEAGAEVRFMATLVCNCGTRRFKGEGQCPGCDGRGRRRS